jgi:uroporphyrinogen-III synthase
MRVVVTRPAAEAADWVSGLRAAGFDPVSLPLISIGPAADKDAIREAWKRLPAYRAAMFVSANAVRGFFGARPAHATFTPRAWATGGGTHAALVAAGVPSAQVDAPPADSARFDSEALWEVVRGQVNTGDRVLLVRGGRPGDAQAVGRDWLEERLIENGALPDALLAYVRARPELSVADQAVASESLRDGSVWVFSSSQAIANLLAVLPGADTSQARAVATHPRIAHAAREAGFAVVRVSRPPIRAVIADLESLG